MRRRYRVLVGLDYEVKGKARRAEPGDVVDDIPAASVSWLIEQGYVEEAGDGESPR